MKTLEDYLLSITEQSKNIEIIPTGFRSLDTFLDGGLMKKEFVVIGGGTGSGKSIIGGQVAMHAASTGHKVAYFSLEISGEMIISRLVGGISDVKPTAIIHNNLGNDEDKVDNAKMQVAMYSELFHIYDDIYELKEIWKIIDNENYDLVVIDFVQNVFYKGTEYERMSFIALTLQKLAKKKNCCILALSQLSNTALKEKTVEYKGSGSIAMVADIGMFIAKDQDNNRILGIRKNRRGISSFDMGFSFKLPSGKIYEK